MSSYNEHVEVLVLAKEPVAGRVKTRLCPPCSPSAAAALAEAALADTFEAALAAGADRVVAVLDGRAGPWLPPGVVVRSQGTGSFNERLARAWASASGPTLQIGMDTPQLDGDAIAAACSATLEHGSSLGPALDGGWWALGLVSPAPSPLFRGIRPSTPSTGRRQLERMRQLGLRPSVLGVRRDVDTWADALAVAGERPGTRFAAAVWSWAAASA